MGGARVCAVSMSSPRGGRQVLARNTSEQVIDNDVVRQDTKTIEEEGQENC